LVGIAGKILPLEPVAARQNYYKAAYWTSYGFVFSGVYLIELFLKPVPFDEA
jgi:hypothetical protein